MGQKRHLGVVGQKLLQDKFVSQLSRNYPHRGDNRERGKKKLCLVGERQFGCHF